MCYNYNCYIDDHHMDFAANKSPQGPPLALGPCSASAHFAQWLIRPWACVAEPRSRWNCRGYRLHTRTHARTHTHTHTHTHTPRHTCTQAHTHTCTHTHTHTHTHPHRYPCIISHLFHTNSCSDSVMFSTFYPLP